MHAYLIIAHNEFEVLTKLIGLLDDDRNDIYVHIDKKVRKVPALTCKKAGLYVLGSSDRIDVRWGSVTQIQAELKLLEVASNNREYQYYHIISGVHLPLKSQDAIHNFFDGCNGCEVLQLMPTGAEEINFKLRLYHLFVNNYMSPNKLVRKIDKFFWRVTLAFEKLFGIYRKGASQYAKASQWCSITNNAANFLLEHKMAIVKEYQNTFCSDEFFIASALTRSNNQFIIKNCEELLSVLFHRGNPITYTNKDYDQLINSHYLFARKFSSKHIDVVNRIYAHILNGA